MPMTEDLSRLVRTVEANSAEDPRQHRRPLLGRGAGPGPQGRPGLPRHGLGHHEEGRGRPPRAADRS
ncbi:MAG: hypothetical protein MZV64_12545 [Ignavibacteriales bacterium]|nr:hypothetical protein [Ignavibacteriales bacterium]